MVHIRAGNLTGPTSHIIYAQQLACDRQKVVSLPGFSHKKAATTSFKRSRMSGSIRSLLKMLLTRPATRMTVKRDDTLPAGVRARRTYYKTGPLFICNQSMRVCL
ncbi:uncharacterized protein MCYG_00629 [Microsporum canis CBS 113480]|uniref:Uncharacterized protein n=1 Tax=Arthroderma otae (strain ATCC MYA-4605 / CBS 113480) TaxID=554155 RepID=C5FD57_ARTOC|nr:uncharacterized protein MCYG_00629 [Microsporum canis CBS 113480]EEQ27741.1 predicted protein [Microsporum canis CBS 113480]